MTVVTMEVSLIRPTEMVDLRKVALPPPQEVQVVPKMEQVNPNHLLVKSIRETHHCPVLGAEQHRPRMKITTAEAL